MTRREQDQNWNFGIHPRAATVALALTIVFALTLAFSAHAQTFQVLHTFTGQGDGANPYAGFTVDQAGRFYGTTSGGSGSVFKFALSGSGWVLSPLHDFTYDFTYPVNNGDVLYGQVIFGPDGNLYGTTWEGGQGDCQQGGGCGTVFKLQPPTTACKSFLCPWKQTVLYRFGGVSDGGNPYSGVIFDHAGNLYGTTAYGGNGPCTDGCGVVYKLTPSGSGWTESVIYSFAAGSDGAYPAGGLVFDEAGNLYGTTAYGGNGPCTDGCGVVYELTPSGSGWTETIVHTFQRSDGFQPWDSLVRDDRSGDLYGVTVGGGSSGGGTFFVLVYPGSGAYSVLYNFPYGSYPYGSIAFDNAGNVYGTTYEGGANQAGTVFKLTFSNGAWTETVLHSFSIYDGGGTNPFSGVTLDSNGNVYGTTSAGGSFFQTCALGCGTIYEITL